LGQDPAISRDFHANKLRDFVRESSKVLSVIKCQNQLRLLSLHSSHGASRDARSSFLFFAKSSVAAGPAHSHLSWSRPSLPPLARAYCIHAFVAQSFPNVYPCFAETSCTSSFRRLVSRAEYVIARKSDTWYFTALLIACTINLIVFFAGVVDGRSSLGCSQTGKTSVNCRSFPLFHWLTQEWSPSVDARAYGLRLSGSAALAVRILSLMHFTFATAMLIGWCVITACGGLGRELVRDWRLQCTRFMS
jgi:hypothetical protein